MQICLWRGFWLRGKQITAFKCLYFISIEMRAPLDHDDLKSKKKTAQRRKFNSWMRFFSWDDFMQTLKKFHWRMYLWSKTRLRLWVTVILPFGTLRIDALMSFSCCYLQRKKILFMFWSLQVVCCYKLEKSTIYRIFASESIWRATKITRVLIWM